MDSQFNNKYYIYHEGNKIGPYNIQQLQEMRIEIFPQTLVWKKGMENWIRADEDLAFSEFLKASMPPETPAEKDSQNSTEPPPIPNDVNSPKERLYQKGTSNEKTENNRDYKIENNRTTTTRKKVIIGVIIVFSIIIIMLLLIKQKEDINQQKREIAIYEQIERENTIKKLNKTLNDLKDDLNKSEINLRSAELKLQDIQQFQLLRTRSEKQVQINNQLERIQQWEHRIEQLHQAINKVKTQINVTQN